MNIRAINAKQSGRGARSNVGSRFEPVDREEVDDGWDQGDQRRAETEVRPLAARSIITYNRSPDIGFDRSINPYKGCEHGCAYCYARPAHAYIGLSPGLDFETKLFWKPDAPALLERALSARGYKPAPLALGADTDPYQPIERRLQSTRAIIEVLARFNHPFAITTKNALVARDIDLLAPLAERGLVKVAMSVTSLDPKLARAMEPRASTPARRLGAIEALSQAGVRVMVMTAPIIPGLNDHEMEAILERARAAGAVSAGYVMLRLPREVEGLFQEWLESARPAALNRVMRHVREMRGGAAYDATWFERGRGNGPYAELVAARFKAATARLGLNAPRAPLRTDLFAPPAKTTNQLDLFAAPREGET